MMGGDTSLDRHLQAGKRAKFWTRLKGAGDAHVQVVCADSSQQIEEQFPQLEVFSPGAAWEAAHTGELFREYDIDKNRSELIQSLQGD
jgi:hypothetical protein